MFLIPNPCSLSAGVRGDRSDQAASVGLQQLQLHSGQPLQGVAPVRGEAQRGREVSQSAHTVRGGGAVKGQSLLGTQTEFSTLICVEG